ncbi:MULTISPECIES: hypothetical protein [unclassified Bradyrhizobium]|uniref:hypothetical protein n=1 Tax=unclassified Bradyrhizobium TaxID=2631580 RepID=UPI00036657C3|nr:MULTISPECIES: hypothetical protein [unclassified Bradyrhizobium]MBB4257850.1 hypothetical protein [Bradyrhizobium sp. CIR3A]MBB4379507.1 hypothetical protein [Bradyrhizobium sp. SBR1B]MBB4393440.1 hypothetical protein [Bradyrhizobium sp. ERR14]MBB4426825.1 hypothetical protein [Bradyrhizobium sp. CIR48]NYG44575.1 hypothetical protein [Bradyrhizobium sp. IAR9]
MNIPVLVMATVNAPYRKRLSVQELVHCLLDHSSAKAACGPMSSFFGDVHPDLQVAFAEMHGISHEQLVAAAKAFAEFSGQTYPLAA